MTSAVHEFVAWCMLLLTRDRAMNQSAGKQAAGRIPSLGEVQQAITRIWAECLGRDGIGLDEDFFDLGGSSISAMHIAASLNETFSVDLPFQTIMELGSAGNLARFVADSVQNSAADIL
jgi:acyl carrier protein